VSERIPFTKRDLSRLPCDEEPGQERRDLKHSGAWNCSLEVLTPLSIKSYFDKQHGGMAFLPGSSLRGMVRNVAEVIGGGCARFYEGQTPRNLEACTKANACLSCRVFGFVQPHSQDTWAGKVRFSDTRPAKVGWKALNLGRERPPEACGDGWMLFPHTVPGALPEVQRPTASTVWAVDQGAVFRFRVEYLNLDEEELAVFKFALTLSHEKIRLCHKLGFAKSLGMGACRISIPKDASSSTEAKIRPYLDDAPFRAFKSFRSIA
jgi:hypothetical protein